MALPEETMSRVELAGKLKQRLVKYFNKRESRYQSVVLNRYFNKNSTGTEGDKINAIDWFIHCYRFPNGDYFLDRFIRGHKDLSDEEIAILEAWKESAGGIFEIKEITEDTALLLSLVDGREFTCASNLGKGSLLKLRPGFFILTRLVPLDEIFLFSGLPAVYPPQARFHVEEMAKDMGAGLAL